MSDIKRIGRPPNPAEVGLQRALERPELRERLARNYFTHLSGLPTGRAAALWRELTAEEREEWTGRMLERQRAYAADYRGSRPPSDEPPPGAEHPTENASHFTTRRSLQLVG